MKPISLFFFTAILFLNACKPSGSDHEKDNTNASMVLKGSIDVKTAKRLVRNFDERSYRKPEPIFGFNDTRYVWFSIGQLDTLITQVKKYRGSGVRFYLAAYDRDSMPSKDYNPNYKDHSTLIMVPTKLKSGKHFDFFGFTENDTNLVSIFTSDPQNRGEMCPPPQTCAAEGATLFDPEQP